MGPASAHDKDFVGVEAMPRRYGRSLRSYATFAILSRSRRQEAWRWARGRGCTRRGLRRAAKSAISNTRSRSA